MTMFTLVFTFPRVNGFRLYHVIKHVLIPLQGAIVIANLWSIHPIPFDPIIDDLFR